jgi:predicted nuclease with TOPRIM domain
VSTEEEVEKLQDRVDKLEDQVSKLEKALSEIYPGWEWGACVPGCGCAACQSY